jgi:hypothetical protein
MSYRNAEFANLLTNARNNSEQKHIHDRSRPNRYTTLVTDLASDAINCALAHWYLLPGLELQRYRLRVALSLIRTPEEVRHELSILPATLYLDGGFALKNLRGLPRVGSYLDVSSPWLFPFYVMKSFQPKRAVLLTTSRTTRNLFKNLANRMRLSQTSILTKELGHLSGLSESFDTITCLARLSPEDKQRELLKRLWQALNPDGTLIVSVACTGSEGPMEGDIGGPADSFATSSTRLYDSDLLKSCILDVLGEPRNYAIYGEDDASSHANRSPAAFDPSRPSAWRESVAVGKYWRRCSSISQVRGRGILAMKFIKAGNPAAARAVS